MEIFWKISIVNERLASVARLKFTILIWKRKNKRNTIVKLFFKEKSNPNSIPK